MARGLGIYKDSFRELNTVGEALQGELGPGWQATGCPCTFCSPATLPCSPQLAMPYGTDKGHQFTSHTENTPTGPRHLSRGPPAGPHPS